MEYSVKVQRRVWSGKTEDESSQSGMLHKDMTLPFVPFVGLGIWVGVPEGSLESEGQRAIEVVSVNWCPKAKRFYCLDREWFGNELHNHKLEEVGIKEYLEGEVAAFWDKYGLSCMT